VEFDSPPAPPENSSASLEGLALFILITTYTYGISGHTSSLRPCEPWVQAVIDSALFSLDKEEKEFIIYTRY